jgi:hypothetical protein
MERRCTTTLVILTHIQAAKSGKSGRQLSFAAKYSPEALLAISANCCKRIWVLYERQ